MQHRNAILTGFAPVVPAQPKVLILGSMPGEASLHAQQYYAHPRNAFWPVMQMLFDIDRELHYEARIQQLKVHGVALWDVVYQCRRAGSLDAAIEIDSIKLNNIGSLLQSCPEITAIFCNGGKAWDLFRRHFFKRVPSIRPAMIMAKLPSTSPANARLSLQQKSVAWQKVKQLSAV